MNKISNIIFNPVHPGLHGTKSAMGELFPYQENSNELMPTIYGNRKTNILDLNQMKLEIFVPGRTDIEIGRILDLSYPDISPKGINDKVNENEDVRYSGKYLITAINHKINQQSHMMSMEIVKDGLKDPSLKARKQSNE